MSYVDHVEEDTWNERYSWLRTTEEEQAGMWGSIAKKPGQIYFPRSSETISDRPRKRMGTEGLKIKQSELVFQTSVTIDF